MRDIFLGKPLHWGMLAIIAAVLWWAGSYRVHVIHFNTFLIAMSLGGLAAILLVLKTTKPGEQVTREDIVEPDDTDEPLDIRD